MCGRSTTAQPKPRSARRHLMRVRYAPYCNRTPYLHRTCSPRYESYCSSTLRNSKGKALEAGMSPAGASSRTVGETRWRGRGPGIATLDARGKRVVSASVRLNTRQSLRGPHSALTSCAQKPDRFPASPSAAHTTGPNHSATSARPSPDHTPACSAAARPCATGCTECQGPTQRPPVGVVKTSEARAAL